MRQYMATIPRSIIEFRLDVPKIACFEQKKEICKIARVRNNHKLPLGTRKG